MAHVIQLPSLFCVVYENIQESASTGRQAVTYNQALNTLGSRPVPRQASSPQVVDSENQYTNINNPTGSLLIIIDFEDVEP